MFVEVDGKPIRASRESAEWCLEAVDVCWKSKEPAIRQEEKEVARKAFEFAKAEYRRILEETDSDTDD